MKEPLTPEEVEREWQKYRDRPSQGIRVPDGSWPYRWPIVGWKTSIPPAP